MAVLDTGLLELPDHKITPWLGKIQGGSVLAALSPQEAQKFGTGKAMVFDSGEAELVGEGEQKGSNEVTATTQSVQPLKLQKTIRMNQEVLWADEDHQLQAIDAILAQIQPALSRALDYVGIHGVNPRTGVAAASIAKHLSEATSIVTAGTSDKPYANLDAADALVLASGYAPSGVALAPAFAGKFSSLRAVQTEQKLYPNLRLSTETSELDGHTASVSQTVSGIGKLAVASNLLGIVGDFTGFRWGIQRAIGLELIEHGDPDGQGDLKRFNQVAFRAEVVYGVGIPDLAAFALIKQAA